MLKKLLDIAKKPTDFFLELDEEQSSQEANSQNQVAVVAEVSQPESSSDDNKTKSQNKSQKLGKKAQPTVAVEQTESPKQVYDPVTQLIVNAVSAKKVSKDQSQEVASNFATDYLIAKAAPNRRPGVSMNKFKEMSRKMKNVAIETKVKQ